MIGWTGQTWAALAMIAIAAIYLARCAYRSLRGLNSGSGCCGSCSPPLNKGGPGGGNCSSTNQDTLDSKPESDAGGFIPLENLTDLARRRKEEKGG